MTGTSSLPSSNANSANSERTQVLYGPENTTSAILKFLMDVDTKLDICADSTWPSVAIDKDLFIQKPIENEDLVIALSKILDS